MDRPAPGYLSALEVVPAVLADRLATAIVAGIQAQARAGGTLARSAEWLWRDDTTARLGRIESGRDALMSSAMVALAGLQAPSRVFTGREAELRHLTDRLRPNGKEPSGTGPSESADQSRQLLLAIGDADAAMSCQQQALLIHRQLNDDCQIGLTLLNIERTHRANGRTEQARCWQQALKHFTAIGNDERVTMTGKMIRELGS